MRFLRRFFGGHAASKTTPSPLRDPIRLTLFGGGEAATSAPAPDYVPSPDAPALIKLVLDDGSPVEMPRENYRTQILLPELKRSWNKPEALVSWIESALHDEFVPDALEPARQLYRIDPLPHRGAGYLAATLLKLNRLPEAEEFLTAHIERNGEDGVVLTNLAKVQESKGDHSLAEQTLWRALKCDPNQENGLSWYLSIQRECRGDAAYQEALRKIASLPNSWRAQLWLARDALAANDATAAMDWFRHAIERANPPPWDMLMQISGDLGNRGQPARIIELCAPHFDPQQHGIMVGNNLIRAYIELGENAKARTIIEQLRTQNRAAWHENLTYWQNELERLEGNSQPG